MELSNINVFLQSIKSALEEEFRVRQENPLLTEVKIIGGGFNGIQDVLNFSNIAPCMCFGIRGFTSAENAANQLENTADMCLYIITTDNNKDNIGDSVLESHILLERAKLLVKDGLWGLGWVWRTEYGSISSKSYFTPEFYERGITLWELSWKQKFLLGKNMWIKPPVAVDNFKVQTELKNSDHIEETLIPIPPAKKN
jgi:hypothetical protein